MSGWAFRSRREAGRNRGADRPVRVRPGRNRRSPGALMSRETAWRSMYSDMSKRMQLDAMQ